MAEHNSQETEKKNKREWGKKKEAFQVIQVTHLFWSDPNQKDNYKPP